MKGWSFELVCPGNAKSTWHKMLLLLKNATVNRNLGFDDVCVEKQALLAYNNWPEVFEGDKSTKGVMVKYPLWPELRYVGIAWIWEIQAKFFESNNIKPQWLHGNQDWGTLNYTSGQWSGAAGMIQRDEVDYAIFGFSGTYERSKVAAFSMPENFRPLHWLTRYPQELSPTWNLVGLFTKGCISQIS